MYMFVIFQILHKRTKLNQNTKVQVCATQEDASTVAQLLQENPSVVAFMVISHKPSEIGWTYHTLKNWPKHRLNGYGFTNEDLIISDEVVSVMLDKNINIDNLTQ